ncbi:MAG TPA: oligopeptide/dipeptide ABC transporter ATP-binding protein [Acidimicrobiales bacterium]|nr:oligopeptide/dipeptide ABC transporter ATP-binding protein [Acidimicrobiales bacterium]
MAGSGTAHLRDRDDIVLRVEHLVVDFPTAGGKVHAVSDVSFDLAKGETLGLVGESGCGKSTTGRAIMQLPKPTSGSVMFGDKDLTQLKGEEMRRTRTQLQMIFQDPISSLNPRRKIKDIVGEGISIWGKKDGGDGKDADQRVDEVLEAVGLDPDTVGDRRAHQFSGGQCQRICVARSLVLDPEIIICDEPVSALDVSVQAQILNLLEAMKARYELTLMFIAHDLAVVKNISDRVAVMYLGKMCELAPSDTLYAEPAHPYTHALLESIPKPDPTALPSEFTLGGELPSPIDPPSGCRFRTRCPNVQDRCAAEEPLMRQVGAEHYVACHFPNVGGEAPASAGVPVEVNEPPTT